jgi:hypothetical protein
MTERIQLNLRMDGHRELITPEAPLLWGVAPWVKADYGWLPPDEKPTEWHIQTHCSSLD